MLRGDRRWARGLGGSGEGVSVLTMAPLAPLGPAGPYKARPGLSVLGGGRVTAGRARTRVEAEEGGMRDWQQAGGHSREGRGGQRGRSVQ